MNREWASMIFCFLPAVKKGKQTKGRIRRLRVRLTLLFLAVFASVAQAQFPQANYLPSSPPLPPPLYVRMSGPAGMQVAFYRGNTRGITQQVPFKVGLRPGYVYRVAISGLTNFPGQTFSPTLEVRGSLYLGGKLKASDYPAGLVFAEDDFRKVQAGALVKKVILLEKADSAIPLATSADQPLEIHVAPNRDPLTEARDRGLPLLLMYMGQRQMTEEELAEQGIPGTILFPGEKVLPPPRCPPRMPWGCYPVVDPVLGPAPMDRYYSLKDGGDSGYPAGLDRWGKLRGLDPSDTVAEYEDSKGRKRLAVSNRVCLIVPRFLMAQGEMILGTQVAQAGPSSTQSVKGYQLASASQPVLAQHQNTHLEKALQRQKPGGTENLFSTSVTGKVQGLDVKASVTTTGIVDGTKTPPNALEPPDRPLLIIKWPDKEGALIGDTVTFFIKYTNQGGQSISNVVVSDNLIPRFQYVPGSARTDREASFTTQPNDNGSLVLRWEFSGTLLPRESGLVSFQVRIR